VAFLKLRQVRKTYPTAKGPHLVLRDIDLAVEEGEFVCILGYSGSGKTTLLSLVAGLIEADAGEILLEGRPTAGPGPDRGMVFQSYGLLPWMTVFENVALAVEAIAPQARRKEQRARTEHVIRLVNLWDARHKRPHELSGGMRQRVAVARGLAMDPKVLLLDEPFSALDALTRATLQAELARIWMEARKTVLMITNDVEEAILLADRVVPLTPGPGATLGPEIPIGIPRPRLPRHLNRDPAYRQIRQAVADFLVTHRNGDGGRPNTLGAA
jgi:nitrate/nitrite transport system ATP-binding protein